MRIDGIELREGSQISNLTVASGSTFPSSPSSGEMFFLTSASSSTQGLYVYVNGWTRISTEVQLVAPNGTSFPANPVEAQLFYKNTNSTDEGFYYYDAGSGWVIISAPTGAAAQSTITGDVSGTITPGTTSTLTLTSGELIQLEQLSTTGLAVRKGTASWGTTSIVGTTGNVTVTNGSGISGSPTINLSTVTNTGTATFQKIIADTYGRITNVSPVVSGDISALVDSRYLQSNQTITISGDATGSGATTIPLTLATVNSSAGTKGSASAVPVFVVNAKGLVTSEVDTPIAITAAQTTSGVFANSLIGQSSVTQHQAALSILETQIVDGSLLARVADNETISGNWTFLNPVVGAAPTIGSNFTTKNYVDSAIAGLTWKNSVKAATTANITLSGVQTVDGISLVAGDRVLVKNQTTSSQNGIYVVSTGAWVRGSDATTAAQLDGSAVYVLQGTTLGDTGWTETATIATVGTDAVVYAQFSGSGTYTAGIGLLLSGNTFSNSGVTSLTGTVNQITVSAATGSVTLSLPATISGLTSVVATTFVGALTGNATSASKFATSQTLSITGDATWSTSFDGSTAATGALTLATVNSNVGQFSVHTVNAKGLTTAATNLALTGDVTGTASGASLATVLASVGTPVAASFVKPTTDVKGRVTATTPVVASDITGLVDSRYVIKTGDTMTGALNITNGTYSAQFGPQAFSSTAFGIGTTTNNDFVFGTNSIARMRIDAAGNAGFGGSGGTTVSTSKVNAATNGAQAGFSVSGNTTATGGIADFVATRSGTQNANVGYGALLQLGNSTSSTAAGVQEYQGGIQFFGFSSTVWNEFMRIDTVGNGLFGGVASAGSSTAAFGHGGTPQIFRQHNSGTGANSQSHFMLSGSQTSIAGSAIGTLTWVLPGISAGTGGMMGYVGLTTDGAHTSTTPASYMSFATRAATDPASGPAIIRMNITSNGQVLIGTNATTNLRVNQKLAAVSVGSVGGASFTSYNTGTTGTTLDLQHANSATDGTLTAIGTAGFTTGAIAFRGSNGSAFGDGAVILSSSDAAWTTSSQPGNLSFYTTPSGAVAATEKMRIDSGGGVSFSGAFGTVGQLLATNGAGTPPTWTSISTLGDTRYVLKTGDTMSGALNINVGTSAIGLKIQGSDTTYGIRLLNAAATSGFNMAVGGAGATAGGYLSSDGGPMWFLTGGSERVRIDNTGNVMIGATTPSGKLFVYNTGTSNTLTVANASTGSSSTLLANFTNGTDADCNLALSQIGASTKFALFGPSVNIPLQFQTGSAVKMTLDTAGNLGIGAASASMRMYITGAGNSSLGIDSTAASAFSSIRLGNGNQAEAPQGAALHYMNSSYPTGGGYFPNGTTLTTFGSGHLNLNAGGSGSIIRFFSSGNLTSTFTPYGAVVNNAGLGFSFVSVNSSFTSWYLLCTLPASTLGTYDQATMLCNFNDNWNSGANRTAKIMFANRGSFTARFMTHEGAAVTPASRIQAYTQADGSTQIYAVLTNGYYATLSVDIRTSTQVALVPNPNGTEVRATPAGTLAFDTYTTAPALAVDASSNLTMLGSVSASGAGGFSSTAFAPNVRNPIWRFGNADAYGLSYFQGTSGVGGTTDTIGIHFGTTTAAGSSFQFISGASNGSPYLGLNHVSPSSTGSSFAAFYYGGTLIGNISQNGTTGVNYNVTSDERRKKNIEDAEFAGPLVDKIKVRKFDWKADDSHVDHGFIAQELVEVVPNAVTVGGEDPEKAPWTVDNSKLVPLLMKALQEAMVRIESLEADVAALKAK